MEEKEKFETNEYEIDLSRILFAILDRAMVVILVSVLCAAIAAGATYGFLTPKYQSSAVFYVNNSNANTGNTNQSMNSNDLVTSRGLVDSYIVILRTRETLNAVIEHVGLDMKYGQIKGMITAGAVNETEMFRVTVTSPDPEQAASIANAIAYVLPKQISNIIDGTSAKIVEYAEVPTAPSSPSYVMNTAIGFVAGFLLCAGMITMKEIFDTIIHSEEDISQICEYPVLSLVPDMQAGGKQGMTYASYAGSAYKKKKKKSAKEKAQEAKQNEALIGGNVSFAASEAYKRLRTKLQFSFAEEEGCRVIGLSSALSGEGKSLTAVNLAYALAQLNKRVILLDCDMRRPTIAEKMSLNKKPGLSEYLTGQYEFRDVLQRFAREKDETTFHVITAGDNPPNPMEMLSSLRMERLLASLRGAYDYVLLDLPPVSEVSDALAMASRVDGMLLVVRQNYGDRIMLSDAMRQFSFINARILGVVFNATSEYMGDYYGYGYGRYGHYYRRYYRRHYQKYYKYYNKGYGYNTDQKV